MDAKNILILIVGLINVLLGLYVYLRNRQNPCNFWFFIMCLFGGGWAIGKALQLSIMDIFWQEQVFVKQNYIFGTLAALAYLMLCHNFPYRVKVYSRKFLFLIYSIPVVLVVLDIFGLLKKHDSFIIDGVLHREVRFFEFSIFAAYFFVYVFCGAIILIKKYFKAEGIHRVQIKYLLWATLGTFLTTGYVSVILVLFNIFTYDWLGGIFLLIHFSFIGYFLFLKDLKIVRR